MTEKHDDQPTQKTPKGLEIPVPKREDVLRDLGKVAPKPPAVSSKRDNPPDSDRP